MIGSPNKHFKTMLHVKTIKQPCKISFGYSYTNHMNLMSQAVHITLKRTR